MRVVPNSLPDGFVWSLLIIGNTAESEQIWCRTYINDCCNGWLARVGGPVAAQQWFSGHYPQTHAPLPGFRFVDATIGAITQAVDAVTASPSPAQPGPQVPPIDLGQVLAELTQTVHDLRDDTRRDSETTKSMFQAISQRCDTDMDAARANDDIHKQRSESMIREGA